MEQDEQTHTDNQLTDLVKMPKTRMRLFEFFVLFLVIPLSIPAVFFIGKGLSGLDVSVDDQIGITDPATVGVDEKSVPIWFQAVDFNPESQVARYKIYVWPSPDLANEYDSSTLLKEDANPIQVWIDTTSNENHHLYKPGDSIGAINAEFDVISEGLQESANDARYPFDKYRLNVYAQTWVYENLDEEATPLRNIKTYDFFYTSPIPGFHVSYKRTAKFETLTGQIRDTYGFSDIKAQREEGMISFDATFNRSIAVQTLAIILGIFCVLSAITLTWITKNIWSKKRPPSMQALVWSAATVLGTVQLRDILPGNPRIGIAMDFIFFFPTLLIGLISSLMITSIWIKRDDWAI